MARPRNHTGRTYIPDLFLEQANDLPLPFHHLDVEVDDSPEEMGAQAEGRPEQLRAPPQASPHLRTHSSRADTRKRKKVFSTRKWYSQGSQEPLEPARSRRRTQTVPASYMVFRVRKGPQILEGFTLEKRGTRDPEAAVPPQLGQRASCVTPKPKN